jgi:hypothetical protein
VVDNPNEIDKEIDPVQGDEGNQPDEAQLALEARARRLGWKPESEWDDARAEREGRKRPANFMSAADFIDNTEGSLPIMRDRLQRLDEDLRKQTDKVNEMHGVILSQREMTKEAVKRAWQQGKESAEQQMRDAVVEGDTDKYDTAKAALEELVKQQPVIHEPQYRQEPQRPNLDPVTENWVAQNDWFLNDRDLYNCMISEHSTVNRTQKNMSERDRLDLAKRKVMQRYPEKFGINPRREAPGTVNEPSATRPRSDKKTFDDLPADAQKAYERIKRHIEGSRKGVTYTKDEYLKEYAF